MTRPVRVLSIDGGGVRGYLPALLLAEIERRASVPAAKLFDLVVGTSTGGIIGIGLAAGLSAQSLADFYPTYGRRIFGGTEEPAWKTRLLGSGGTFSERMGGAARRIGSPFGGNPAYGGNARHRPDGLEGVLRDVLGDVRLSQAAMDLAITSFDGLVAMPVVFSRRDALADANCDLPLRDVARATSAAPTYFPPLETDWAGRRCLFVDGGVWANNPSGVAVSESLILTSEKNLTGQSVFLVSLGTGMAPAGAAFEGTNSWIGSAGDIVKTATSVVAGELLASRAVPVQNYRRLQVVDNRVAGAMDDPSSQRLGVLKAAADDLIRSKNADLDEIVARLAV
ncbi:patatin-like phospholipase family protein [Streptomyces sp. NBC_01408]|uniref:patatin-like phospholipase family protein n=1 Tax=Streptomyces sp. NBC_01408 TaxID=2903855 RepID=UPI002255B789|nr:patatin-like phospholipase family protein [Streptomyces sp. NBC_01408]MCX4694809.1 patatin-like phospholipase family protein [Streptomyces sp. NBC_01408]